MTDLLVATNRGLRLVRDNTVAVVNTDPAYGVTWDNEGRVFIGETQYRGCGKVVHWTRKLKRWRVLKTPIHDIHQLLWIKGRLYYIRTNEDKIETLDGRVLYDASRTSEDHNHINSIWNDGELFWIVKHRRGVNPCIVVLDQDFNELRTYPVWPQSVAHNCGLHNVYVEGQWIYTLGVDTVYRVNMGSGKKEIVWRGGSYLRGLAKTKKHWFVGNSLIAKREERKQGDGALLTFNNDWSPISQLVLKDVGQVHEIRALHGDMAHNGVDLNIDSSMFTWSIAERGAIEISNMDIHVPYIPSPKPVKGNGKLIQGKVRMRYMGARNTTFQVRGSVSGMFYDICGHGDSFYADPRDVEKLRTLGRGNDFRVSE